MWNGLSSRYNQVPFLQDWTGIDVQDVWEMPTPDDDSRWGTSTGAAGVPELRAKRPMGVAPSAGMVTFLGGLGLTQDEGRILAKSQR
jgi:hypothetical protein